MTYQVLARKWRPQDFSGLIGQQPIVTALRNALTENRIGQAYLFSGIRGVGKTSAARLLAKALNCEKGPAADPCNECAACKQITAGSDLDVVEVDAATYSKVEQVRELTESLQYAPARDRFKVVVIDEIHRLSRQAFDALLKIVEEPPPHLVFVFATTEIEAIPATILSRCQEYHFRRVATGEMAAHLRHLCEQEGIEASDAALRLLARAGEGSVRDSIALLDQLATFGRGTIEDDDAARLIGGLDLDLFGALLGSILAGETGAIAGIVAQLEDRGLDPRQVYGHFLLYCRDALHLALGADVDLAEDQLEVLGGLGRDAGYENLLRLLHHLLSSEAQVRRSESAGLAVEIAWMRAAELPKLVAIEGLLGGAPLPRPATPPKKSTASSPRPSPSRSQAPAAPRETPREPRPSPPPRAPAPSPPAERAARAPTPSSSGPPSLEHLLEAVSLRKQALAAHLREAAGLAVEGKKLLIHVEPGDDWLERALIKPSNRNVLQEVLTELLGAGAGWEFGQGKVPIPEEASEDSQAEEVVQDPTVQAVLDIFGGKVEGIQNDSSSTEE